MEDQDAFLIEQRRTADYCERIAEALETLDDRLWWIFIAIIIGGSFAAAA